VPVVFGAVRAFVLTLLLAAVFPLTCASEAPRLGTLSYDIEWRLIHAGTARIDLEGPKGTLKLDSAGLVSALYKIDDSYAVQYDEGFCVTSSLLDGMEGKRHRRLQVTVDRATNHASFVEQDLLRGSNIGYGRIDVPNCVHDVLGAIHVLRGMNAAPGQTVQLPMSDGRHAASVKVEAQEREDVVTPAGTFHTIRYEPGIMNGVIYPRKGRAFIWLTDDAKKTPVQIRLRLAFPIGTVTLQLEKGLLP